MDCLAMRDLQDCQDSGDLKGPWDRRETRESLAQLVQQVSRETGVKLVHPDFQELQDAMAPQETRDQWELLEVQDAMAPKESVDGMVAVDLMDPWELQEGMVHQDPEENQETQLTLSKESRDKKVSLADQAVMAMMEPQDAQELQEPRETAVSQA